MRWATLIVLILATLLRSDARPIETPGDLVQNGGFEERAGGNFPAHFDLNGDVEYRYLGDPNRDRSSMGIALLSARRAGSVSQTITGIDAAAGRWFRFTFRGLPEANFAVGDQDLYMKVAFFGDGGKVSYDTKAQSIYPQVQEDRRNLTVNGKHHERGAEVWRTYQMDFMLPFPQVSELRLSVGFGHGEASRSNESEFFVDDFSLVRIPTPPQDPEDTSNKTPLAIVPSGKLIPLGGRWYYAARSDDDQPPSLFDASNSDRLLYHDAIYSAPFAGNMTAWLRAGDLDINGNRVTHDRLIADNVTVAFDADTLIIHTHGIPNHPTGKFPGDRFSGDPNPNSIGERLATYFIPLDPKVNPRHFVTTSNNSNHALPMGPIGIALNGVVFFNPFDMGNRDAADMMDRCCGHPNQDNQYHYHKYPICIHSPWADDGKTHSPLIGFAFDGFPLYGPYEKKDVMAKDMAGESALNAFNMHYDPQRGWHYHVTPGKFPYLIGGYWGTEDSRDNQRPPRHGNGPKGNMANGRGFGNGPGNGPGGGNGNGFDGPPPFGPPPFPPP
jgi:hypothetical protein